MSKLEDLLLAPTPIPWDKAASFFVAVKEVSKTAESKLMAPVKIKKKQAAMTKVSGVGKVRHLWKMASGEGSALDDAAQGFSGVAANEAAVEPANLAAEDQKLFVQQKPKKPSPESPEAKERQRAEQMMMQEQLANQQSEMSAAQYYQQLAAEAHEQVEQLGMQLEQTSAQMAQMQEQIDQMSQQTQMTQMQADQATQQAQMQAQQDAAEKQQLTEQMMMSSENVMQLRQAMQAYREHLQQLALQDPTAPVQPGMAMTGELGEPVPPELAEDPQAQELDQQAQAEAQQEAAGEKPSKAKSTEQKEKTAGWKNRAIGAAIGAPLAAGIQSLSDLKSSGGESNKERALRRALQDLKSKKDGGALHKHRTNIANTLYETAKVNRQHPQSAAVMAAVTGGALGAMFGPQAGKAILGGLKRVAKRG